MSHKVLYPYIYILLIFAITSLGTYKYLFYLDEKFDLTELKILNDFIYNSIKEDSKEIENNHLTKSFLLPKSNRDDKFFYLQEISERLDKLIPNYVDYKISINGSVLGLSKNREVDYLLKSSYQINNHKVLTIDLGIDINSEYYLKKIRNIYEKLYKINLILFGVFIFMLGTYIIHQKRSIVQINYLNEKIRQTDLLNQQLTISKEAYQKIEKLFVKKFNKIQVFKTLDVHNNENLINNVSQSNVLPFCLIDKFNSTIEVAELFKDLKAYFNTDTKNINLNFKTETSDIQIPCAKESFYQIIFSLFYNIIIFMNEQSNVNKELNLKIYPQKITISYQSFPLSKDEMVLLSDQIFNNFEKIFILNCRFIFNSIEQNRLECKVTVNAKEKLNEINLYLVSEAYLEKAQVINFTKK